MCEQVCEDTEVALEGLPENVHIVSMRERVREASSGCAVLLKEPSRERHETTVSDLWRESTSQASLLESSTP
jgi:hypothetical protein